MELPGLELEKGFTELVERIGRVFAKEAGKEMAGKYLQGLLSHVGRKNSWQMAERLGEETPYRLQQFLYRGRFSADGLRDELQSYVGEKLGETDGALIVDDTGFLKQGKKSCGVKRQYTGTAGKITNCQIGVFLTYASSQGHAPIDRRLYLPEEWCADMERRHGAGIPDDVRFQTKPQMALEMIQEATTSNIPYTWVTGDCAYGDYRAIRQWLEEHGKCYVLCVSGKEYVWQGMKQIRVSEILQSLPEEGWFEASCGDGSKGARVYDWMWFELQQSMPEGFIRSMLVRRSKTDSKDLQAFVCYAPESTLPKKLVETAGIRWTVERCFAEAKSEVGMDHYEVRSFDGWYKHITLACLALALLTVLSASSMDGKTFQAHNPVSHSLEAFKRGRGLRV
jgi:SRSO17 transposase